MYDGRTDGPDRLTSRPTGRPTTRRPNREDDDDDDDEETRDAAYGPRRLVRFKIVGPLLIQADIIGGVCYLHTLVRALLVQDRITKKNMENLFGRS